MTSRIEVYCRVRPTDKICTQQFHFLPDNTTIQINRNARRSATGLGSEQQIVHTFTFDSIFTGSQATQENVYRATTMKLVQKGLLDGINSTLLCYGQRDSGKTYTVFGGNDYRARGIAARAINQLFEGIRLYSQERVYEVGLTFLQIHGERITDLLAGGGAEKGRAGAGGASGRSAAAGDGSNKNGATNAGIPNITLDGKGMVALKGIEKRICMSEEEALAAVFEGLHNRTPGQNAHLVLSLYARHQSLIDSESATLEAVLHVVDLAGTQRAEGLSPEEQAEVQKVNRSLSMLEQVVLCLGNPPTNSNGEPVIGHVPYRQSKLTTLLKDCIGGTSLTSLIAHIYPEQPYVDNTISTLNFAKRMMHVVTDPTVNTVQDATTQIRTLQRQVIDLKSELRMQSQLSLARVAQAASSEATAKPATFGTDELQALHEKVRAYVDGGSSTIHVNDVREMNACFSFFRSLLEQKDVTIAELQNEMNAAKAQSYAAQRDRGNRSDADSSGSVAGGGGAMGAGAGVDSLMATSLHSANSSKAGAAAPSALKGKRRGTNSSRQQMVPPVPADLHTPNVLDKHSGVSYGVAGKASNTLQVPDRDSTVPPPNPLDSRRAEMNRMQQSNQVLGGAERQVPLGSGRQQNVNFIGTPTPADVGNSGLGPRPLGVVTGAGAAGAAFTMFAAEGSNVADPLRTASGSGSRVAPMPPTATKGGMLLGGGDGGSGLKANNYRAPASVNTPNTSSYSTDPYYQAGNRGGDLYSPTKQSAKARAFEDYKNTESGSLQVRALGEDREQLQRIDKKVDDLHQRLQEIEYVMEEKAHHPSGGIRVPLSSRPQSGGGGAADDFEDPRRMSHLQLTAYHNTLKESLGGVNAQRAHLVKQMERRRNALMTNFCEWYARISGDPSERPARTGHFAGFPPLINSTAPEAGPFGAVLVGGAGGAGGAGRRGVQTSFLDENMEGGDEQMQRMMQLQDDRFLDAAERFDAMEMQRRTAQDPRSGAFYAAKKLVESKTRDRPRQS